jgi:RNA polymerase sigma-70 factor (ECF subfamily)
MAVLHNGDPSGENLTELLQAWGRGDESALEQLTPVVYGELYRLARLRMLGERGNHILQPSALVNELFVRLMGSAKVDWVNRTQFYAISARMMRQILTDFARASNRRKRSAPVDAASIQRLSEASPFIAREDLLAIDSALDRLESVDPRRAKVVELRFYGGLDNSEIAAVLVVSEPTIVRDWRIARASLFAFLEGEAL